MVDHSDLLHRKQCYSTPIENEVFPKWNKFQLGRNFIYSHPALDVKSFKSKRYQTLLLGKANATHPSGQNLDELIAELDNCNMGSSEFFKVLNHLTGAFLVWIYESRIQKTHLFPDSGAVKELFFTSDVKGIYTASQPCLLSKVLTLKKNPKPEAIQFFNSIDFKNYPIYPMGRTEYENVIKLLPNHYLDLEEKQQKRFFPFEKKPELSLTEGVQCLSSHLKLINKELFRDQLITLPLTAGWDSRVLLASLKEYSDQITCYTSMHRYMDISHIDIRVPLQLTNIGKLYYSIHKDPDEPNEKIVEMLKKSISHARIDLQGSKLSHIHSKSTVDKVILTGTAIETTKNYYRGVQSASASQLAKLTGFKGQEFAIESMQCWLENSLPVALKYNYKIMDLFHWEQNVGGFVAKQNSESNISKINALYLPFNNKHLISNLLGVKDEFRGKFNNLLFEKYILEQWPELLKVRINPSIKSLILDRLEHTRFYSLYKSLFS